jgi:hypothetical protein
VRSIIDSRRREREVAETECIDCSDCFPAFTARFSSYKYPEGFKPIGITKYDGKQAAQQWLRCYSTAIEVAGGSNITKFVYFPMALDPARAQVVGEPQQQLDRLLGAAQESLHRQLPGGNHPHRYSSRPCSVQIGTQ